MVNFILPLLKIFFMRTFFLLAFTCINIFSIARANSFKKYPEKIITINLIEKEKALIGKDTFSTDGLTAELKQRLWGSFTGTGKMQDELKLQYSSTISPLLVSSMTNAIKKAQQDVLTELCLQLHKKRFDELNDRQQNKIKKQYPVLFQQKF